MRLSSMHYFPLAWPFVLALVVIFTVIITLIELHILKDVYRRIGIPPRYVLLVLLGSLLGSAINLPVAELRPEAMATDEVVDFYGVRYVVPVAQEWPRTILAVNVGGAVIPTMVSLYLLVKNRLYVRGIIATAVVAVIVYQMAYPVRGIGIAVPTLAPPIVAAVTAMTLAWRNAPPLAYIAGSLGTLIGADLMNLDKIQGMGAPVASIGGAGTFDGVFLSGVFAVLLSSIAEPKIDDQPEPSFVRRGEMQ
jgi:uncharacterized membrane protein